MIPPPPERYKKIGFDLNKFIIERKNGSEHAWWSTLRCITCIYFINVIHFSPIFFDFIDANRADRWLYPHNIMKCTCSWYNINMILHRWNFKIYPGQLYHNNNNNNMKTGKRSVIYCTAFKINGCGERGDNAQGLKVKNKL